MKGRQRNIKSHIEKNFEEFTLLTNKSQNLFSDVMHVNDAKFLVTVAKPLDLTITTKIKDLKSSSLKEAFKSQLHLLRVKGFEINNITADGAFSYLKQWFLTKNIQLSTTGEEYM